MCLPTNPPAMNVAFLVVHHKSKTLNIVAVLGVVIVAAVVAAVAADLRPSNHPDAGKPRSGATSTHPRPRRPGSSACRLGFDTHADTADCTEFARRG